MSKHSTPRRARGGSPLLLAGGVAIIIVVALLLTVGRTYAFFTDSATVSAGPTASATAAFTSGSIATPTVSKAEQDASGAVITWAATTVGAGGARPDGYEVYRYGSATGGSATLVCAKTTALTCTDTASDTTGTVYYELRAYFYNWTKSSARASYAPDRTAPSLYRNQPSSLGGASASTLRNQASSCGSNAVFCGTAQDDAGVSLIEYTLRRQYTANRATVTDCWSGSQWQRSPDASCDSFLTARGTTTWVVPGNPSDAYMTGRSASFLLKVRGTDPFGNSYTGTVEYSTTG